VPPMYSAIKQGGVRLYERARAGEEVVRAPRPVRIDQLELLAFEPPRATVAIACSKGTYVRSLIADLGNDLGCGAHMAELRRTRSGRFTLGQAQRLDALDPERLVPMTEATGLPAIVVPALLVPKVRVGVQLDVAKVPGVVDDGKPFQILDEQHTLLAIAHTGRGRLVYERVFPVSVPPPQGA
jgi:tRNA U55 pseudouridine synthase TruB